MTDKPEKTPNGIAFTQDIAGIHGARFVLFTEKHHSEDDVEQAKKYIRDNRDVVSISVAKGPDWDDLYKGEIFRHPKTRDLKWYQINCDKKAITRERKKGTSIDDFVERFVLHRVKLTEAANLKKFGSKMYHI